MTETWRVINTGLRSAAQNIALNRAPLEARQAERIPSMLRFLVLPVLLLVAACDSKPREPPPDIIKSQRQAMDKAKGVEQVLEQSAGQRREQDTK